MNPHRFVRGLIIRHKSVYKTKKIFKLNSDTIKTNGDMGSDTFGGIKKTKQF